MTENAQLVSAARLASEAPALLDEARPAAILRGTARGLEIVVWAHAPLVTILGAVSARLAEAPGFFRGCNAVVRVDEGPLPPGTLGRLEDIAQQFEIRIVEVAPLRGKRTAAASASPEDGVPRPNLALGSAPAPAPAANVSTVATVAASAILATTEEAAMFGAADEPTTPAARAYVAPLVAAAVPTLLPIAPLPVTAPDAASPAAAATSMLGSLEAVLASDAASEIAPVMLAADDVQELDEVEVTGTRVVVGPVRSGVILEHRGHLVIFGDVNPGAEVRAEGNIVVLGRLRGTAHAGIGAEVGFILGLRLEPQQLRIGRKVARASETDVSASEPEIAYVTGESIVVEHYQGRLPRSLAASI